jgi:hypothetical protein
MRGLNLVKRDVETAMGMVRRRTRRRTMLIAGGAAYAAGSAGAAYAGKRSADSQDDAGYEEEAPPAPPPPAPTSGDSQADEIERLAELHSSGALTDEEFAAAKVNALGM